MRLMFAALCSSALLPGRVRHPPLRTRADTHFLNHGPVVRPAYFAILISHVVLSAVAVPLILASFFLSLSGRYSLHRRVSRFTFPIWLYGQRHRRGRVRHAQGLQSPVKPDRRTAAAGAATSCCAAWVAPARACPMCKDGTAVDAAAQPAETAGLDFNTSIYVMLGVVAVVGGAAGRAMVKAVRG